MTNAVSRIAPFFEQSIASSPPSVSSAQVSESSPPVTDQNHAASLLRPARVNPSLNARGGRQKDDAWKLVDIDEDNSVWCHRCGQLVHTQGKNHVARVRRHDYEKCGKLPPQAKITDTFKPTLQPTALQAFQERFANWVFSTGMPFYRVEHPSLLKVLQLLNSSVKLPSCFQLSTTFLDKAYVRSLTRMEFELGGAMVTIVTDGWTNNNGLAVINYVAVSGKKTYFLESVYTGCQGHDAAYLVSDLKRVIAKYKFLKVGGVVTDNTATNKSVWDQMQPDFPHVFFHGCVCHALHLLVKDTVAKVKWLDTLQAACKILVGFFKTTTSCGTSYGRS